VSARLLFLGPVLVFGNSRSSYRSSAGTLEEYSSCQARQSYGVYTRQRSFQNLSFIHQSTLLSISIYMDVETTSSAPSTGPSILQVPTELQKTHNLDSRATNADLGGDSANLEADTYKGLDWKLFPGFQIPPPSKRDQRSYI
jgi:hypothetical protein